MNTPTRIVFSALQDRINSGRMGLENMQEALSLFQNRLAIVMAEAEVKAQDARPYDQESFRANMNAIADYSACVTLLEFRIEEAQVYLDNGGRS